MLELLSNHIQPSCVARVYSGLQNQQCGLLVGSCSLKSGVGNPVPSEPQGVLLFVFALRSATNSEPGEVN